jgi:hypothetical protein
LSPEQQISIEAIARATNTSITTHRTWPLKQSVKTTVAHQNHSQSQIIANDKKKTHPQRH